MHDEKVPVISWVFTFIVLAIPIINIIYLIALLFGGSKYDSKVSFVRALFLTSVIVIVLLFVIGALAFGGLQGFFDKILGYIQQVIDAIKNGNIVII